MIGDEEDIDGGIYITPQSEWGKTLAQFEQFPTPYAPRPGNPYTYRPFPKMMYRAEKFQGRICIDGLAADRLSFRDDAEWTRAQEEAARFTERCQLTVQNELEMSRAYEAGWRESPQEAVAHAEARDRDVSTAAAERAHADRHLSEAAQREVAQAEAAAEGHLAEIPERPRRRGRPPKRKAS